MFFVRTSPPRGYRDITISQTEGNAAARRARNERGEEAARAKGARRRLGLRREGARNERLSDEGKATP
jgi:hypothetical protein